MKCLPSISVKREFDSNMMNKGDLLRAKHAEVTVSHCLESRLIEVMRMKMNRIQSLFTVNLIEMRLLNVIGKMKNSSN
jgi:hypothetical protein